MEMANESALSHSGLDRTNRNYKLDFCLKVFSLFVAARFFLGTSNYSSRYIGHRTSIKLIFQFAYLNLIRTSKMFANAKLAPEMKNIFKVYLAILQSVSTVRYN